jgi:hypothetical protein
MTTYNNTVPNNVNVHEDTPNQVIINQDSPNQVIIRGGGIGGTSSNTRRYVHTQEGASAEWVIHHNLGGHPSVTIVDSANTAVFGEVQYDSNTQVTILFTVPFSGLAYLT